MIDDQNTKYHFIYNKLYVFIPNCQVYSLNLNNDIFFNNGYIDNNININNIVLCSKYVTNLAVDQDRLVWQ